MPPNGLRIAIIAHPNTVCMEHWAMELQKRGHHILYITPFPLKYKSDIQIRQIRLKNRWGYLQFWLNKKTIEAELITFQADIVHSHYSTNYGLLATRQSVCPAVVTVAGSDLLIEPYQKKLFHFSNAYVFKRASIINAVSNQLADVLKNEYKTNQKVEVFPEGVNRRLFFPDNQIPESPVRLISTRNFKTVYNHQLFVECVPKLVKSFFDVQIIYLGDGPQRKEFENQLLNFNQVTFKGWISREEVANELKKSQIYISTSFSDGTSTSLLEAMACGLFPIVSDIPANHDWIEDGINGFLVPVDDSDVLLEKIKTAVKDFPLRQKACAINTKIIADKADDQVIVSRLENVYKSLV